MISVEFDDPTEELAKEIEKLENKVQTMMELAGEKYITEARQNGSKVKSYEDRTGNLRNSNSYVVRKNGQPVREVIGRPETAKLINEEPSDAAFALICGAGMEYASFVEAKGFDVVSSAQLATERFVEEELRKLDDEKP